MIPWFYSGTGGVTGQIGVPRNKLSLKNPISEVKSYHWTSLNSCKNLVLSLFWVLYLGLYLSCKIHMLQDHNCEDSELYLQVSLRDYHLFYIFCVVAVLWFCDSKSTICKSRILKESEIFCWLHGPKKIKINRCIELSSSWKANCNFFQWAGTDIWAEKPFSHQNPNSPG